MRMRNPGDLLSLAIAGVLTTALSVEAGSRVIVSTTLDSTLAIFDADSLAELQSPLPSKGGGPVRLWVQNFDGRDYLFPRNPGAWLASSAASIFPGGRYWNSPCPPLPRRPGPAGTARGGPT